MPKKGSRHVTMADIAREAGVSIASASRALNGLPGVSAETTARIRAVAERSSYVVSPEASGLKRQMTGRVAVVTSSLSRWYHGEVIEGIESVLSSSGLDLLVYAVGSRQERRDFFERLPARRKADAVIVVGMPVSPEERARLDLLGVSIVAAGGQDADYPYVTIDDERAGRQAMDHLIFLGHRRIAMIDAIDPNEDEWPIEYRAQAYRTALQESGEHLDPDLFVQVPWGPAGGAEGMRRLLSLRRPPTAVFVHSDDLAFGALHVLREAGLQVPDDMSVVSIDDHPLAEYVDLTTVRQDPTQQGELAARSVIDAVAGKDVHPSVLVPTVLVPRGSTARIAP